MKINVHYDNKTNTTIQELFEKLLLEYYKIEG